jgi:hypothetical protein
MIVSCVRHYGKRLEADREVPENERGLQPRALRAVDEALSTLAELDEFIAKTGEKSRA